MITNRLLVIWVCLLSAGSLSAQNMNAGFGKNRVQYHHQMEEWSYYETAHLSTYWYGDARNVAIAALQLAEYDFDNIQQLLEHQLTDRIELLVFSDVTDLKQSNIGVEELFLLRTGETKVMGNKIFVYFDGDHNHLRTQVREGIAGVVLNSMMYGVNLQEIVQNAVLLNLPEWYTNGLIAFCGEAWNESLDVELRDLLATGKFNSFDKLVKKHPKLAGHAFWYYISKQFGQGSVSNLLYLTRINRGLDAGFRYVLGNGYERTTNSVLEYYNAVYQDESRYLKKPENDQPLKIKNKGKLPQYQVKISPDGKQIAWVTNDIGKWKVWVQDIRTGKRKRLMKGGVRNQLQATDYAYPLITWHPDNQRLVVLYERRDMLKLATLELKTGKKDIQPVSPEFQRVYGMDFINPVDMVLSAASRGYTDLFIYHTVNRQTERLTQDMWDDLDPAYAVIDGRRSILFSSNRTADTLASQRLDSILPIGQFDLFLYDLETRSPELIRLSHTSIGNERQALQADSAHFVFLSDENGINNRKAGYLEPYIAYHQTVFYLKNGAEVKAWADKKTSEWEDEKILAFLSPADTVRKNLDSTQIDSIRIMPVFKKRAVTWTLTNYDRHVAMHDVSGRNAGKWLEMIRRDQKNQFILRPMPELSIPANSHPNPPTRYRESTLKQAGLVVPTTFNQPAFTPPAGTQQPSRLDSIAVQPGWLFQMPDYLQPAPASVPQPQRNPRQIIREEDEITDNITPNQIEPDRYAEWLASKPKFENKTDQKKEIVRFSPSKITAYRLKFRTDFVSTTMDNNLLFDGLDSYAGSPAGFRTPPPGVLLRANFKELMENYTVEAGFRLPTSFNGAEYYLLMDDRKKRLDRRYALYRKTTVSTLDNGLPGLPVGRPYQTRTNTLLGQYEVRYPIDPFFSLRAMATLRQDKRLTLTTERPTLEQPDYAEQRAALRLSAVYDNTLDVDLNIKNGTRARLYVEAVKRFEFNTQPNWRLKLNSGFMTVVNLDARHYQRLDRKSILALRLAGATTFGSERILYYLGGVDNWLIPRFDNNIKVPQDQSFAYQTLAANMRGFRQNIRNGNSFVLLNTELRVPVFKYLMARRPTLSAFWRNFQAVGFFDTGTAWVGPNPYSGNNPLNIVYVENPPTVYVKVNYFRDPLVAGYGFGVRMPIFGMYLRADYAWGIETRVIQKPMLYLALGADF